MNIAPDAIRLLAECAPINVEHVEWNETELVIGGTGWNISILTPWRILYQGRILLGSDTALSEDVTSLLSGNAIIDSKAQSSSEVLDPTLVFKSGHVLEVFSAGSLEPWTLFVNDQGHFVA